jgi:hypothetical protein
MQCRRRWNRPAEDYGGESQEITEEGGDAVRRQAGEEARSEGSRFLVNGQSKWR